MPCLDRRELLRIVFVTGCLGVANPMLPPAPVAAQGVEFWNKACRKLLKQYAGKPHHKAFATSNSSSGGGSGQACGMSWSAGSKKQAEDDAIKSCKSQRAGNCWVIRSE